MTKTTALLYIYTETPLHVGSGEGLGAIDLPIQRERITKLPFTPGSGLKGALRETYRLAVPDPKDSFEIDLFGPEPPKKGTSKEPDHAGALTITDARLLLLPIRTVYGGWAWATSPMILERLARDLEITGTPRPAWADLAPPAPTSSQENPRALIFAEKPAIAPDGKNLLLEDTLYTAHRAGPSAAEALVEALRRALPDTPTYAPIKKRLSHQLIVLDDEKLKYWAVHGTEVTTRVRIDDDTGAVAKGALWTEEALPAESLLWSLALVHDSRNPQRNKDRSGHKALLKELADKLPRRAFLGGDRTIGHGLCALNLQPGSV